MLDDGYLPSHLYLMGLANQINTNACTCTHIIPLAVELLAWKWIWLTRCPSRDLLLLLALMLAIVIVHLNGRAEALGHTREATAPMGREVMAAAVRLRHAGVMHIWIGMVEHTSQTKYAMPVKVLVMLQQIACSNNCIVHQKV
jgi:hypothetical protein